MHLHDFCLSTVPDPIASEDGRKIPVVRSLEEIRSIRRILSITNPLSDILPDAALFLVCSTLDYGCNLFSALSQTHPPKKCILLEYTVLE